jgi:hypothetical protein
MKETEVLRFLRRVSYFVAFLIVANTVLAQTQFSADIVDTKKEGTPILFKIYFAGDRVRLEPQLPATGPRQGSFILINRVTHASTVVMPQQREYIEAPQIQELYRRFYQTVDVENACAGWLKLPQNRGAVCSKVGSDAVNGRGAIKYEVISSSGEESHFWLDPKLDLPIKWDGIGRGELRNIQEGTQPAGLFEVPADYAKSRRMLGIIQPSKPK